MLVLAGVAVAAACSDDALPEGGVPPTEDGSGSSSSSGGSSSSSGSPRVDAEAPSPFVISNETVQAGGNTHDFVLVVPRTPSKAKLPIIFAYHGDGGSGSDLSRSWPIHEVAGSDAIVVYPDKPESWSVFDQSPQNPNLAGFDAMLDVVVNQHGGDRADVTATGWSAGGFFSQIIACWRGAQLRSVSAMAGSYPYDSASTGGAWANTFPKCEGMVPVAALIMHGDSDGVGNGELSAQYWTYVNKCSPAPDGCNPDYARRTPTARPPCVSLDDAPATAPVTFCNLPGFGHGIWNESAAALWEFSRAVPQ